ncbi:MAG: DnaJ domain-containing protein [Pseudomonadales bacterium]
MILKALVVLAIAGGLWLSARYFNRIPGAGGPTRSAAAPTAGPMTRAQAAAVLGIPQNSDPEAVRKAHRRLIAANHPDRGGSDFLAQQVNEARDVLIDAEQNKP